jgi:protein SCO1/2
VPSRTRNLAPFKRTTDGRGRLVALAAGVLAAGALALWLVRRPAPLPTLGAVPDFDLVERSGQPVHASDLDGEVWVANFIFTRCPDVCPALTARMARLQNTGPEMRLVSFSVDPTHDTPAVLADYARRTGAEARWLFLTGPRERIATLLRDGFKVAYADDGPATAPITHSDRFVLVDRARRIRGYYHGSDPEDLMRLARDARALRDRRVD